jgi:CheY-like chemotaxis protein
MQNDRNQLAGKRILIVEDEFMVAELLLQTLQQWGAEVVGPASTLAAGLTIAKTGSIMRFSTSTFAAIQATR